MDCPKCLGIPGYAMHTCNKADDNSTFDATLNVEQHNTNAWVQQAKDEMNVKGYKRVSKQTVNGLIKEIELLEEQIQKCNNENRELKAKLLAKW